MKYKLMNIYLLIFWTHEASSHGEQHNTHENRHTALKLKTWKRKLCNAQ